MKAIDIVEYAMECLEMFGYTCLEKLGNNDIKSISPMKEERIFHLAKFGKDFTLYSQRGLKLPLSDDYELFECEILEEDSNGEVLFKIYYSDYVFRSKVKDNFYFGHHNLKAYDSKKYTECLVG